jgi:hypothetical protein
MDRAKKQHQAAREGGYDELPRPWWLQCRQDAIEGRACIDFQTAAAIVFPMYTD